MRLQYLGDALDHWKGALLSDLVADGQLTGLGVYPMASDAANWTAADYALYARLLRVPRECVVEAPMRLAGSRSFPKLHDFGDVFLDPDTGVATGKVKHRDQYVTAQDIYQFLGNGLNRIVAVYQHVRAQRTRDRVAQVVASLPNTTCWASYESGSVAMLFFSLAPWRTEGVAGSLRKSLGHRSSSRVFSGSNAV